MQLVDRHCGPIQVHCVTAGTGPDVVLLHGYVQSSWCWRHNIDVLARQFRVTAVCALGLGWSDKPLHASYRLAARSERTLQLLDALGIERAHMVGNSLGGALAMHLAQNSPSRVGKVVLVNPAVAGHYPMAWLARTMRPRWRRAFRAPGVSAGFWLGLRVAAYHRVDVDETYMRHFLGPLAQPGAVEAALLVARYYARDLALVSDRLHDLHAPLHLVIGKHDRIVPATVTRALGERLPGAAVATFEHSAHCPHEEEPERFNANISAFLRD